MQEIFLKHKAHKWHYLLTNLDTVVTALHTGLWLENSQENALKTYSLLMRIKSRRSLDETNPCARAPE